MTYSRLLDLADPGSFERGEEYAAAGRATVHSTGPGGVTGVALGSEQYDLTLDEHGGTCSCPMGQRAVVCKHLVALALILDGDVEPGEREPDPHYDADGLLPATGAWLAGLDAERLRDVVRTLAATDDEVADSLDRLAATATGDVSVLRPLVDSLRTRGHLDYYRANDHGRDAYRVVDALEEMLSAATADAMLPLLAKGLDHLIRAISRSDDSSGIQSGAAAQLLALHAQAASLGSPDPAKLAKWMAKIGFADTGWVQIDPIAYAKPLGERGLTAYRREVEHRLEADPTDFHAQQARQRLAILDRDIPAIVEHVGGSLDRPVYYQRLVEALLEIGAEEEALAYAVDGVTVSPVAHQTIPLYDTAVRLLRVRGGAADEVLRLRRQQLDTFPIEQSYVSLRRAAKEAGRWNDERLLALDVLLACNPSAWLRTLLDEGEIELAWEASQDMAIEASLALALLRARATSHPGEVLDRYAALVRRTLEPTDQGAYREGVSLLGELRRAAVASGQPEVYDALLDDLLVIHKRRPTLMTLLRRMLST